MGTTGISYSDLWTDRKEKRGKRHRFRVRDPQTKRYESECFESYEAGEAWAKKRRRDFLTGRVTAAPLLWSGLGKDYVAILEALPAHPRHTSQVRQVIDAIEHAGGRSVGDDAFPTIVQHLLLNLKAKRAWATESHPASPALKLKFLVIARAICGQAVDRGFLRYNPLGTIKLPKVPRRFRPVFSVPDLAKLVAPKRTPTDRMWRTVAVLLVYTGVRSTEARAMVMAHVDPLNGYCEIPADHPGNKSKVARRFPLQDELRAELTGVSGYIINEKIRRMSAGNFSNGFKDYCQRCGVVPRGPHAMRHTVASLLTALGMSPYLVMDYIGHETASVTKHYSRNADSHRAYVKDWPGVHFRLATVV